MKAVVFTLGCKVNECESDSIISALEKKGYEVSDKLTFADIYIVNTCAVTAEAEKKSRQTVSRIKKINPNAKIIFMGCASQKSPNAFIEKDDNFLVIGTFNKDKVVDMLGERGVMIAKDSIEYEQMDFPKTLRSRAFIKVQDGCNNFCSYCIIPYLRGRSRSRSIDSIVEEINFLEPKEAVLTGINLSAYKYQNYSLTDLIKALSSVNCRIRLGSLEVNVITEEFLSALKELKNFAPHFHLSLQSGSDEVLKKMNRHYTSAEFLEKVNLIRKYFVNAGITTDIIVGFPTETEENFKQTLDLVKKVNFADIHPFTYSARSGTVAYKMQDLDAQIKKQRLIRLMQEKQKCKTAFAQNMINKTEEFLFEETVSGYKEGYLGNYLRAYLSDNCAVDGIVKVKIKDKFKDGVLVEVDKGEN